jgi:hypothetical protein
MMGFTVSITEMDAVHASAKRTEGGRIAERLR